MLKNLVSLGRKPMKTVYIILSYYLSLGLVICFSLFLIIEGFIDPFGNLMIWVGLLILFIVPVLLRVFFDFALMMSSKNHEGYQGSSKKRKNNTESEE